MKKYILLLFFGILFLSSCTKEVLKRPDGPATDVVTDRLVDSLSVIHLLNYNFGYAYNYAPYISLGSYAVTNKTDSSITVHGLVLQITDNYNTVSEILYRNGGYNSNLIQMDPNSAFIPIEETIAPGQSTRKVNIMSVHFIPFNYSPTFGNMLVSIKVKNVVSNASTEAPKTNSQISFYLVP